MKIDVIVSLTDMNIFVGFSMLIVLNYFIGVYKINK
jgi:hypothetical protein